MTISLPGTAHEGTLPQSPFPLYVILARLISDVTIAQVGSFIFEIMY